MTARWPGVTTVAAIVIGIAWLLAVGSGQQAEIIARGAISPARLSGGAALLDWSVPAWLTPLSACFIHADAVHLGFNLLMLVFCGRQVEPALGGRLLTLLLVVAAYGSAMTEWAFAPQSPALIFGASGAISAVVGLYALLYNDQQVRAIGPIPAHVVRILWLAAAWIGVQALIGYGLGDGVIAIKAHIGGFLIGLLLARPLLRWRFRHQRYAQD